METVSVELRGAEGFPGVAGAAVLA